MVKEVGSFGVPSGLPSKVSRAGYTSCAKIKVPSAENLLTV